MVHLESLENTQEVRVSVGWSLEQLLRFFRGTQLFALPTLLLSAVSKLPFITIATMGGKTQKQHKTDKIT